MSTLADLSITRAAPLSTVQDSGRFGALADGVAASGPMDRMAWEAAGGASSGLEFTRAGLAFEVVSGATIAHFAGGVFVLAINGRRRKWPSAARLKSGDRVEITPGEFGLYGYVRFSGDIDVPKVLGSRATNTIAGLGGLDGRPLKAGDQLRIVAGDIAEFRSPELTYPIDAPFRFVWGIHADLFDQALRRDFVSTSFFVSHRLDRMGVRLEDRAGVFQRSSHLSLVSDSVVPGDMQVLGDGTPIVLMRDHQPTGGYPRIATLLTEEISRFAQMRSGSAVRFEPVSHMNLAARGHGGGRR